MERHDETRVTTRDRLYPGMVDLYDTVRRVYEEMGFEVNYIEENDITGCVKFVEFVEIPDPVMAKIYLRSKEFEGKNGCDFEFEYVFTPYTEEDKNWFDILKKGTGRLRPKKVVVVL